MCGRRGARPCGLAGGVCKGRGVQSSGRQGHAEDVCGQRGARLCGRPCLQGLRSAELRAGKATRRTYVDGKESPFLPFYQNQVSGRCAGLCGFSSCALRFCRVWHGQACLAGAALRSSPCCGAEALCGLPLSQPSSARQHPRPSWGAAGALLRALSHLLILLGRASWSWLDWKTGPGKASPDRWRLAPDGSFLGSDPEKAREDGVFGKNLISLK